MTVGNAGYRNERRDVRIGEAGGLDRWEVDSCYG